MHVKEQFFRVLSLSTLTIITACAVDTSLEAEELVDEVSQAVVPADIADPPINEIRTQSPHERLDPTLARVEASIADILPPNTYIETRDEDGHITDGKAFLEGHSLAQRMGESTWLVQSHIFSSMAILGRGNGPFGQEGWLLVDCGGINGAQPPFLPDENGNPQFVPGGLELQNLLGHLDEIAEQELGHTVPVIAGVPTHPHGDHNGNFVNLRQMFPNMRLITSRAYRDFVKEAGTPLELPNKPQDKVIYHRKGKFLFDGKWVKLWTPAPGGHTPADSIVISPDGVAMAVDVFGTEGRLGFIFDSVVENPQLKNYTVRALLGLAGYECDVTDPETGVACEEAGPTGTVHFHHLVPGHFGNGTPKDLISSLRYARSQDESYQKCFAGVDPLNPQNPPTPLNPADFLLPGERGVDYIVGRVFYGLADCMYRDLVEDNYQKVHWNVAGWQQHIERVQELFLFRATAQAPSDFPEYTPITPNHTPPWGNWM